MKVLFAGGTSPEAERCVAELEEAGHVVKVASDTTAVAACTEERPSLVLLEVPRDADGTLELISRVRGSGGAHFLLYLMLGPEVSQGFLRQAYDAGVDGDIRGPFANGYLGSRVAAAARLARRPDQIIAGMKSIRPPRLVVTPSMAPAPLPGCGALESEASLANALRTETWRGVSRLLHGSSSAFFSSPAVLGLEAMAPTPSMGCSILLVHAADQLELRVAVGVDARSARTLAMHAFGQDGEELAADMLNEVANQFMGTLRQAFATEGLAFTGGLAEAVPADHVARPPATYKRQETFSLTVAGGRLLVCVGLRSKANSFLAATALREGMVIAKDVFNARGLMLINGGTRLSRHMAEKLRTQLAPRHLVEVATP